MRPFRICALVLAISLLFGGGLFWMKVQFHNQQIARANADCAYRNYARDQIRGAFTDLISVADPTSQSEKTREFEAKLAERLPTIPCDLPPSPVIPTP